jgi:hypothetical protein
VFGCGLWLARYPGLADSPLATRCRPLRGLASLVNQLRLGARALPRARGLALSYTLPPAARAWLA